MSKIGTISIDMVANTGKLLAPLRKAETAVAGFGAKMSSVLAGIGAIAAPLTAAIGGLVATATAVGEVKQAFGEIDNLAKESDRLGIATEQLVGLQHAAGLAGVESEVLGKSLQFMMKQGGNVGELGAIADQIASMSDPTERMQYAIEKFGKGGAGMINMLSGGAAGVQAMQQDAEKLGLTLSRLDAAKVEMAGDAISRIGLMIDGVARKIAIELAPFLKWAADSFVELGTSGEGWGNIVRASIDTIIGGFATLLNVVQPAFGLIAKGWYAIVEPVEYLAEQIVNGLSWAFAAVQQGLTEAISFMVTKLADFIVWVESYLPESMQTGLGGMAQEFAKTYETIAEEQRAAMESKSWEVDLDMTSGAKSFLDFTEGDKWGDRLKTKVEQIRADATAAAASAIQLPEGTDLGGSASKLNSAALERGSSAAMSAILGTRQDPIQKEQLSALKNIADSVKEVARNTSVSLAPAGIS